MMDNLALFVTVMAYHQNQHQNQQHNDNESVPKDEKNKQKKKKKKEKKRKDYYNCDDDDDDDNNLYECVALLHTHHSPPPYSSGLTNIRSTTQTVSSIRRAVRRGRLYPISVLNPFGWYIRNMLVTLSEEELKAAMMVLDHRFPRIGIGSSSGGEVRGHDDDAGNDEEDGSIEDKELKTKIRRWRMATRLVQMATDGGIHGLLEDTPLLLHHNNSTNNHQNNSSQDVGNRWKSFVSSLRREYYALCPPDSIFNLPDHSCLPNCLVEGTTITVTAAIQDGNNNDEDGTGPIHLSLIATHDIRQNDVLHISKIDDLTHLPET